MIKPFVFQQFSILQSKDVFRVGTDGVLLGASVSVEHTENILEVGTGTGLIAMMIAQRNPKAKIMAIELNKNAVELARKNFENSPFSQQLSVIEADFKKFNTENKFDLIISNPPFFEENPSEKDVLARQQKELTWQNLIQKSATILSKSGILAVIIPYESGKYFETTANEHRLFLHHKKTIFGIKDSKPKRLILEFATTPGKTKNTSLVIENSPRKFSAEYLELTKGFHHFKK